MKKYTFCILITLISLNGFCQFERINFDTDFGWRKLAEYPGQYYYEVVSFIDEESEGECPKKCLIKKYYYVWRFDPWTSELIHKEKMVQYSRWSDEHGVTGGYEKIEE